MLEAMYSSALRPREPFARGVVLLALSAGCSSFGYPGLSAKHIDCKASEIAVTDVELQGSYTNWTASCRGKSYYCGGDAEGEVACKERVSSEPPPPPPPPAPPPPPPAAPVEPAPAVAPAAPVEAAPLGCQYDTQCKGDRLCVDGKCVDPPIETEPAQP